MGAPPSNLDTISESIFTKGELQSCLTAALDSYGVQPDLPSKFLYSQLSTGESGKVVSIFAFPGSHTFGDWVQNSHFKQCSASAFAPLAPNFQGLDCSVHEGFFGRLGEIVAGPKDSKTASVYIAQISAAVAAKHRILFTGHSLGGAVAMLAALMMLNRPNAAELDIACCTFAAPLVGDDRLAALVQSRGWHDKFIHVVWRHDIVPRLLLSPQPLLHKVNGLMKDGALKGLKAFLSLLAKKHSLSTDTASGSSAAPPVKEEALMSAADQDAIKKLSVDVTVDCRDKAAELAHASAASQPVEAAAVVKAPGLFSLSGLVSAMLQPALLILSQLSSTVAVKSNLVSGLIDDGTYRPFGIYVLHTPTGTLVCGDPQKALHMLYLTMTTQSSAVDTSALAIVEEHFGPRYRAAVEDIVRKDALNQPRWQSLDSLIGDTRSMFELGILGATQDILQSQAAMLAILREAYHRPPQWYEREQTYLAAQKAMDVIFAYREKHKEAGADYYEAFKAYKNPEDYDVEVARRELRVFWDVTVGMYAGGELPQSFFERGLWLTRARTYTELVEPIEVANYYRCELWKTWDSHQSRHYIQGKRPQRFDFFEAQWQRFYPAEPFPSALMRAQQEADLIDRADAQIGTAA